ncbi:hypothetical protein V6N13_011316 [Hibiscus sabdariffa]
MSLTIPTNLSKSILKPKLNSQIAPKVSSRSLIVCSSSDKSAPPLQAFSAALALSSILLSAPLPAVADISGLTPCKESKQFAKREKQQIKKLESSLKLYAPDSAPALAIKATIEKTKRRFDNYGKYGLLCGSDGLPHLIVSGDQRHWGEFITPGLLFLYIAGWIGWVGRSYLIAISDEKKPAMKEIIIDVPLATRRLIFSVIEDGSAAADWVFMEKRRLGKIPCLVRNFAQVGRLKEAAGMIIEMKNHGLKLNAETLNCILGVGLKWGCLIVWRKCLMKCLRELSICFVTRVVRIEHSAKHQEDNGADRGKEGADMGSMQLLNVIQSAPKTEAKGLLYVDITINRKETRAMVDKGASHYFISLDEANKLGFKTT